MTDLTDKLEQIDRSQEENQAKHKANELGLGYSNLINRPLDPQVLRIIPLSEVERLQCIPIATKNSELVLGVVDPASAGVSQGLVGLGQMTGLKLQIAIISASSFVYGKKTYELLVKENEGEKPVVVSEKKHQELASLIMQLQAGEEIAHLDVTDFLTAILTEAISKNASDIHLEPTEKSLLVRFRIDGVLHKAMTRPFKEHQVLLSRIKYLSKMPLTATTKPQDGRFTITVDDKALDMRVASLPTVYGEMVTIRLLRKDQVLLQLESLGLRSDLQKLTDAALAKPHGMILVTGPTGSGKTTTLYALLQKLNTPERKVITIEDPVEYKLPGLEQSQVESDKQYGFADALRGALRQDPDVLMVGEIRDTETASIAIRAALTGHVVLATMHTNNAPASYSRLLEMGVEPFLFSGSVSLIVAQRLLRVLCAQCKKPHMLNEQEMTMFKRELGRVPGAVYEAVGCKACGDIGYTGRIGIFEMLIPTASMEQLALMHSSVRMFEDQAQKDGMITMLQDALLKVEQGATSLSEALRVTAD